jgi:hypothetical protein
MRMWTGLNWPQDKEQQRIYVNGAMKCGIEVPTALILNSIIFGANMVQSGGSPPTFRRNQASRNVIGHDSKPLFPRT